MKLKFKHQQFQEDAANAVCDVFSGQPNRKFSYKIDMGNTIKQDNLLRDISSIGYRNNPIEIPESIVLDNIQKIQRKYMIKPSDKLEGYYNLTIEMETGVGKTYTYIKTMYELNKRYGWSKYIVVVPSIAIREGVYKSFEITKDHFAEDYNKKIRYFIYDSRNLNKIDSFANDSGINVMIINSQAFNARGKDARRIRMELDSFRSRKPIDVIASVNPILIIDEPQSVEGKSTKETLKDFHPLFTLRYSATHKELYNFIYRLDAIEAYNKHLVKKIAVKGITSIGTTSTESYIYLEKINLYSDRSPTALIEYEFRGKNGVRTRRKKVQAGFNLYEQSGNLEQYKNGYTISDIDGYNNCIEFTNGVKIFAGDVHGNVNEAQIRKIQIREAIKSHIEKERNLFKKGIKVLTLFFIDEVAKYKQYDNAGNALNGIYGDMFEEEYRKQINIQENFGKDEYWHYLNEIRPEDTHAGYFSIDKKNNRFSESKISNRREYISDDVDAYDLIMKDKERLLDQREPVRFIFSHSALREGWDNPNVFQICTLKKSSSDIRKRQEVGRGLRLCVNNEGERMDTNVLAGDVHNINILTVIANESYDIFARQLQEEIAEAVADRPKQVKQDLFTGKIINGRQVDSALADKIIHDLVKNDYINDEYNLTDKYYEHIKSGTFELKDELMPFKADIIYILDTVYNPEAIRPENAMGSDINVEIDNGKLDMKEFKELWQKINKKSAYVVNFDNQELVSKSIKAIDDALNVSQILYKVEMGEMSEIKSKEELKRAEAFKRSLREESTFESAIISEISYDLIGKIVENTGITRRSAIDILKGISEPVFMKFRKNPEEFIIKASKIINEQKATVIIEHITYNKLDEEYSLDIFTKPGMKIKLGLNAIKTNKHIMDYVIYDSKIEKEFAENLDKSQDVAIYIKLPNGFYINTPVGKYNPDWAISFHEGTVKHIYFVAETKGDLSSLQLREIEKFKISCAKRHFSKISNDTVVYDVVDSYEKLIELIKQ